MATIIRSTIVSAALLPVAAAMFCACSPTAPVHENSGIQLLMPGAYPCLAEHGGTYYMLTQDPDVNEIFIYASTQPDSLGAVEPQRVFDGRGHGMDHIWSPELSRIQGKWYIYFEADDGNTDNHEIYVLENPDEDPLEGSWTLHGPVVTDREWNYGIHPSTFELDGRQYLLWSGWEHRRVETETQCLFIAAMENPWTLSSPRVKISGPDHEWERQWINPGGDRTAYPIFVNENPEPFISPDGRRIIVAYSASGLWTDYCTLGVLYADAGADLLDPASWHKLPEPQHVAESTGSSMARISNISVLSGPGRQQSQMLFQATDSVGGEYLRRIYRKSIGWDDKSLPVFR